MEINKIAINVPKVIKFLGEMELTPDEKIAVLRSSADIINQVLSVESLTIMYRNMLEKTF